MPRPRRRLWLLPALALWLPPQLPAYTVEPTLLVLAAEGSQSSGFLRLANRTLKPTAIELVVNEFDRDAGGRGIAGRRADDQFIVYPAQLVLLPGDEASVQLRWIGATQPGVERAFSVTTREVAIPAASTRTGEPAPPAAEGVRIDVNVLVNYDVRVYVQPRGARSRVVVEQATVRPQPAPEQDMIEVTLANLGNAHQSLRPLTLVLVPLGTDGQPLPQAPVRLAAEDVPGMSAALLAGGRRQLRIPRPAALPGGQVRVLLSE